MPTGTKMKPKEGPGTRLGRPTGRPSFATHIHHKEAFVRALMPTSGRRCCGGKMAARSTARRAPMAPRLTCSTSRARQLLHSDPSGKPAAERHHAHRCSPSWLRCRQRRARCWPWVARRLAVDSVRRQRTPGKWGTWSAATSSHAAASIGLGSALAREPCDFSRLKRRSHG